MGDGVKRHSWTILGLDKRRIREGHMRLTVFAGYRAALASVLEASLATAALLSIFHVL
jgi:hypothetical protein